MTSFGTVNTNAWRMWFHHCHTALTRDNFPQRPKIKTHPRLSIQQLDKVASIFSSVLFIPSCCITIHFQVEGLHVQMP